MTMTSQARYRNLMESDIHRLILLYGTQEEFTYQISNVCRDPFRTTSWIAQVNKLDDVFRESHRDTPLPELKLSDFDVDRDILNQLPNLLKTYVLQFEYNFGNHFPTDYSFCYLMWRIIQGGKSFKAFNDFTTGFVRAFALTPTYRKHESDFESGERPTLENLERLAEEAASKKSLINQQKLDRLLNLKSSKQEENEKKKEAEKQKLNEDYQELIRLGVIERTPSEEEALRDSFSDEI